MAPANATIRRNAGEPLRRKLRGKKLTPEIGNKCIFGSFQNGWPLKKISRTLSGSNQFRSVDADMIVAALNCKDDLKS
jgi:hypothetical protein